MKKYLGLVIGIIAFIGVTTWISIGNSLNDAQQECESQWSQVENVMQRRYDLIPNLTASVKGDMHQEQKVFSELAKARANYNGAKTNNEKLKADAQINVIHEKYPKLNSDSRVHDLMVELEGSENRISVERRNYIQRVKDYNKLVRNFPSSVVAQSKNMHVMNYYQANSQAYNAPKVDLD
ncbi:LemA family protein [Lactobacillus gasseri]|uniref:LemA family protein n=1 Tax=Lactobacillus gasseri TaxID=1596 RepID=UPI003FA5B1C6